jgi:hypothetical protein
MNQTIFIKNTIERLCSHQQKIQAQFDQFKSNVERMKIKLFLCSLAIVLMTTANAQFSKLHEFTKKNDLNTPGESKPVYDGKWIYDVTKLGGSYGLGEIFKVKPDGTGYTKLYDFNGSNGSKPTASLLLDGGMLYGMTPTGGVNDKGVIFKMDTIIQILLR